MVLRVLLESRSGPYYLGDFESICMEEGNAASPAACGYHLPLWVEGNTVERLGMGVLESQLSPDCVPQLEKTKRRNQGAGHKWPLSPGAPGGYLIQSPASARVPQVRQSCHMEQ